LKDKARFEREREDSVRKAGYWLLWMSLMGLAWGQQASSNPSIVPTVIRFSGNLSAADGKPPSGLAGVTFSLYKDEQGGAPLWMETQNVQADKAGHYTAMLGSTTSQGLPADLFATGEARWLGVRIQGQEEQPRVLLISVPYALKALDAQTLAGKPASAFMAASSASGSQPNRSSSAAPALTGSGTPNHITKWITSTKIGNSGVFETGAGNVGIGTVTPAAKLDLKGSGDVRDTLTLFPAGSHPTLSISGTAFRISNTGNVTFVAGQQFPGTGTITAVNPGTDLTGGGTSGSVTLNVDTTKVPQLNSANTFTGTILSSSGLSAVSGPGPAVSGTETSDVNGATAITGTAAGNTQQTIGVNGVTASPAGIGMYGVLVGPSNISSLFPTPASVWGDTNTTGAAVLGTADTGTAGVFFNNTTGSYAVYVENFTQSKGFGVFSTSGNFGACNFDTTGSMFCNGTKSAVVPVDNGTRNVALYAVEAPENWFEDFGSGQLSSGTATISLESIFAQTVNTGVDYHVFLTPNGECEGLYVTNKSAQGFEVRELHGGHSNVGFDYRIVARRKGYETIRMPDKSKLFESARLPNRAVHGLRNASQKSAAAR
jgi:hypothetical protein